ncbi:MAG: HDIG domain-containing protein [Saprospiraceae bacterium]|nr:HDIG domain-containing protein [Saprospiraceae bacterium]
MIRYDKKYILIYAIAGLTIGLLSFLFPDNISYKFEYEEGKVWRYEDLIAPFDFGIMKPARELQEEYSAIDSLFRSHYIKDGELISAVVRSFEDSFLKTLNSLDRSQYKPVFDHSDAYLNLGKSTLRKYYSAGIYHEDSLANPADAQGMTLIDDHQIKTTRPLSIKETSEEIRRDLASSDLDFAGLLYPLLLRNISPNIIYDEERTDRMRKIEKDKIALTRGKISRGELIVAEDAVLTKELIQRLDSYQIAYEQRISQDKSLWIVWLGYLLLCALLIGIFIYLVFEQVFERARIKDLVFMLLWIVVFVYITWLVDSNGTLSLYIIPYCIAPIVLKTFFDNQIAFYTYVAMILTIALVMSLGFEFILIQLLAGTVAIATNRVTRYWTPFFQSILLIGLSYAVCYLGLTVIKEGNLQNLIWKNYIWFVVNVLLVMLAYPLVPLLERIFGFTSAITLAELGDVNKPILKELSLKAPGTFQHSLQVANIAEAAAEEIGADSLLLRVSALYHDVGKMKEPELFVENQSNENPHKSLAPEESARRIIAHVAEGVAIAKKQRLPRNIVDMIKTHHGTTRVEYFYNASLEQESLEVATDDQFRYPGPKPRSKEETILMMADSIEAACKSLKSPSEEDINSMVDQIISGKERSGQFSDSKLSYHEMQLARNSFKKVLKGIYHLRIEYPVSQA